MLSKFKKSKYNEVLKIVKKHIKFYAVKELLDRF